MDGLEIIVGARPYDFLNDKGERIVGVTLFTAEKDVNGVVGYLGNKTAMTPEDFKGVFGDNAAFEKLVMKPVVISYNKRGKPTYVEVVTQQK
jgi:hypothetical protein